MDKNSLSHTQWECKYHIVFAPKFRRKVVYVCKDSTKVQCVRNYGISERKKVANDI